MTYSYQCAAPEAVREHLAEGERTKKSRQKHVVWLWAVPRSMSTVIAKAFTRLSKINVIHEPFTDAYYFGEGRRSARYGAAAVGDALINPAAYCTPDQFPTGTTFIKELAFQGLPFIKEEILACCTHSFLLRHPAQVLASLLPLKPDFTEEEFGFTSLEYLLLLTQNVSRQSLAVLDGDRLRRRPEHVMHRYCDQVNIPFDPRMLSWSPGPVRPWKEHEEQSQRKWHGKLETSCGFLPPGESPSFLELRRRLSRAQCAYADRAMEIYDRIHRSFAVL